jgi:hypothetical protein
LSSSLRSNSLSVESQSALDGVDFVEATCFEGDFSSHDLLCENGDVVRLSCNGSGGILSRLCPIHNASLVCSSLENQNQETCRVLSESLENISCECSLLVDSDSDANSNTGTDHSSTVLNFRVVSLSLVHEFVTTWLSADEMSASEVAHNLTVLFSTASVAIIGVILMLISSHLDHRDEKMATSKKARDALDHQRPSEAASSSIVTKSLSYLQRTISSSKLKSKPRQHRKALMKQNVIGLNEEKRIEDSLPVVMRPVPLLEKCKSEVVMHHRWIGVYFRYSSVYSRPLRVLILWMNVVIMLFIQSVTYSLADPDDGSCENQSSMESCLSLQSSLSNGRQCNWNDKIEQCTFRPIDHDFDRVLIVAVLSGVMSTPFSILFQSLILFVLSAKTKNPTDEMLTTSRMSHIARRTRFQNQRKTGIASNVKTRPLNVFKPSPVSSRVDALPTSLHEDLGLLLQRIRLYRKELSSLSEIEDFERKFLSHFHFLLIP